MLESVTRNVSVSSMSRFARVGWIDRAAELKGARAATRELSLRPDNPAVPVRTLSGGNQQKAVLARWLLRGCRVLLLDEPTRVSTSEPAPSCTRWCAGSPTKGSPYCWSPARCPKSSASPTGCSSCARDGSCTPRPPVNSTNTVSSTS